MTSSLSSTVALHASDHPYLRLHVDPSSISQLWRHGSATVIARQSDDYGDSILMCLGDPVDLAVVLAEIAATSPPPARLSITAEAVGAMPASWPVDGWTGWSALSINSVPEVPGIDSAVALPLDEWAEPISAFLDAASPDGWGRPGRDSSSWWGILDADSTASHPQLLAVGGVRTDVPPAHLSGIAAHPSARGRGLGSAITAALTRVGLAAGHSTVTLDAYSANTPAMRMYARLGYTLDGSFVGGTIVPPS